MMESPTLNIRILQNTLILSFIYTFPIRYLIQEANVCISFMAFPKLGNLYSIKSTAIFKNKITSKSASKHCH